MDHDEVVTFRFLDRLLRCVVMWWRVEQPGARDHSSGVSKPRRIPERPYFARRLIARSGTSVEVVVGGGIKEKRLHYVHALVSPASLSERLVRLYSRDHGKATISREFLLP